MFLVEYFDYMLPVGAAQGGGGSFKIRKPTGEVGCCELRMVCLRLFCHGFHHGELPFFTAILCRFFQTSKSKSNPSIGS